MIVVASGDTRGAGLRAKAEQVRALVALYGEDLEVEVNAATLARLLDLAAVVADAQDMRDADKGSS